MFRSVFWPPSQLPRDHMITDLMSGPDEELGMSEWVNHRQDDFVGTFSRWPVILKTFSKKNEHH